MASRYIDLFPKIFIGNKKNSNAEALAIIEQNVSEGDVREEALGEPWISKEVEGGWLFHFAPVDDSNKRGSRIKASQAQALYVIERDFV